MVRVATAFTILSPLTGIQLQCANDYQHRFIVNPSGRRSRKTIIGKCKTLVRALRNPGHCYFSGAPVRAQAKAIFWEWFKKETKDLWARPPNETDLIIYLLNGTEIHVVGLDKPQRVEGRPWNGFHITEMADTKSGGWAANLRPLLSDTKGWAYLDGVPEGRGEWYDINLMACGGSIPKTETGVGTYIENPTDPEWAYYHWHSADVLDAKEIEAAKRVMDESTFRQEYEGSFEGGEGLAHYCFSNDNLKAGELDKSKVIHIGMDFNWDPMCSIAAQESTHQGRTITHILKSFAFRNCGTVRACEQIINHFGEDMNYAIYPDPACQNRNPHGDSGKSDLVLIRQAFSRAKSARIYHHTQHPRIKDRLNAVNSKLRNAFGEIGMFIDPTGCKDLIRDFQKMTREEYLNGESKDKSLGHLSAAIGYYTEYRFPVTGGSLGTHHSV